MEDQCPYCNKAVPRESLFCVHCGKKIVSREPIQNKDNDREVELGIEKKRKSRFVTILNILTFLAALACIGGFLYYYLENKINTPADKNPLNEEIVDNLYRNMKYKFRIKFPKQWHIQKGDGPNILVKASNGEGSSISIYVKDQGITLGDIDELLTIDEWANSTTHKFPDAKVLEKKQVFMDNKKAFFVRYYLKYKALDKQADVILYNVALTNSNLMYTITAGAPAGQFSQQQSILDQSVMTFVLEDYKGKGAAPDRKNELSADDLSNGKNEGLDKFIEDLVRKGATDEEIDLLVRDYKQKHSGKKNMAISFDSLLKVNKDKVLFLSFWDGMTKEEADLAIERLRIDSILFEDELPRNFESYERPCDKWILEPYFVFHYQDFVVRARVYPEFDSLTNTLISVWLSFAKDYHGHDKLLPFPLSEFCSVPNDLADAVVKTYSSKYGSPAISDKRGAYGMGFYRTYSWEQTNKLIFMEKTISNTTRDHKDRPILEYFSTHYWNKATFNKMEIRKLNKMQKEKQQKMKGQRKTEQNI